MIISEVKIIATSLIEEGEVSLIDNELAIKLNGNDYILDRMATDQLQMWQDIRTNQVAPMSIQNELSKIALNDPDYSDIYKRAVQDMNYRARKGRRHTTPTAPPPTRDGDEDWYQQYAQDFQDLEESYKLTDLPREIKPIFKRNQYAMMDEPGQDFVTIWPTPIGIKSQKDRDRGLYILRKRAHQNFPQYKIRAEEPYTTYLPQIATAIQSYNLLQIRKVLEELDLGRLFRRDFRIKTIGEWIPSELFSSYDDLIRTADEIIENIEDISRTITEEPIIKLYRK